MKLKEILIVVGGIVLLVGACLMITGLKAAPYIYLAGAVLFAVMQFLDGYHGSNFVAKRLRRQQLFGALMLVATGVLMLTMHHNEWIVGLLIATLFELYTAFRLPAVLKDEE